MKVKKLVILAAGMGTRFLPITKGVPKEMLPLVDKPIIGYLVEEGIKSGIEEVIIVISDKREPLKHYYEKDLVLEERLEETNKIDLLEKIREISNTNVKYVYQDKALGSGYALSLVKDFIKDEPFALMYSDDVLKGDIPALKEAIDLYQKTGKNVMGVTEVPHELTYKYGIMELDKDMKIINLIEKPKVEDAPSNYASIGRMILKPDIFDMLEDLEKINGEYYLSSALYKLIQKGEVYACPFKSTYFDTGSKIGYLKASLAYSFDNEDIKKEVLEFFKNYE